MGNHNARSSPRSPHSPPASDSAGDKKPTERTPELKPTGKPDDSGASKSESAVASTIASTPTHTPVSKTPAALKLDGTKSPRAKTNQAPTIFQRAASATGKDDPLLDPRARIEFKPFLISAEAVSARATSERADERSRFAALPLDLASLIDRYLVPAFVVVSSGGIDLGPRYERFEAAVSVQAVAPPSARGGSKKPKWQRLNDVHRTAACHQGLCVRGRNELLEVGGYGRTDASTMLSALDSCQSSQLQLSSASPAPLQLTLSDWQERPPLPWPREQLSLLVVDDTVFAIGGQPRSGVQMLAPDAREWKSVGPLQTDRFLHGTVVMNDTVFAVGGGYHINLEPQSTLEYANIHALERGWTTHSARLMDPRQQHTTVGMAGALWSVGGIYNTLLDDPATTAERLDPREKASSWIAGPLYPRRAHCAVVLPGSDSSFVIFSGVIGELLGCTLVRKSEEYDARADRWRKHWMPWVPNRTALASVLVTL